MVFGLFFQKLASPVSFLRFGREDIQSFWQGRDIQLFGISIGLQGLPLHIDDADFFDVFIGSQEQPAFGWIWI